MISKSQQGKISMTAEDVFRDNVRRCLEERGVPQWQVADAAGITQPQLSRIITGLNVPTIRTCGKIAVALGVPLSRLLCVPGKKLSKST